MPRAVDLADFRPRSDTTSLAIVAAHLAFVVAPLFLGVVGRPGPQLVILWLWFGLSMNGLLNLMHECAHYHVFRQRTGSDFLGRWVLGPLAVANFDAYRRRHWEHHRHLGVAGDTKDIYLVSIRGWRLAILLLRCLTLIEAAKRFTGQMRAGGSPEASDPSSWMVRVALAHTVLIVSLLAVAGWSHAWDVGETVTSTAFVYVFVYAFGLAALTTFAAALRAIAEHQLGAWQAASVGRAALRNFTCGPVSRLLMGAYGFGEHATHHLEPSLAYYHLLAATVTLAEADPGLRPGPGYIDTLVMLARPNSIGYR